jgi:hypothetical protein
MSSSASGLAKYTTLHDRLAAAAAGIAGDHRRRMLLGFLGLSALPGVALAALTWLVLYRKGQDTILTAVCVRDYLNAWAGGALVRAGEIGTIFHPEQFDAWLKGVFGSALPLHTWSYPPPMLFLAVPFSLLPIAAGFVVWGSGSLALLFSVLRRCGLGMGTCLAIVFSPAAIETFLAGQNGAITAVMLEGGVLLMARRPLLAGVLFGLLTSKPQLGVLLPVCLVAAGRWRVIGATLVTGLALMIASGMTFGWSAWLWYATDVRHFMTAQILEQPFSSLAFQRLMATPFILSRSLQASLPLAYALQAMSTAVCAVAAWRAWRMPDADAKARMALTGSLALLATPYGFSWDMIGAAIGIAVLGERALKTGFYRGEGIILALAWAWPGAAFWLGYAGLPSLGCLPLAGVAFCAWRRLRPQGAWQTSMRGQKHALRPSGVGI